MLSSVNKTKNFNLPTFFFFYKIEEEKHTSDFRDLKWLLEITSNVAILKHPLMNFYDYVGPLPNVSHSFDFKKMASGSPIQIRDLGNLTQPQAPSVKSLCKHSDTPPSPTHRATHPQNREDRNWRVWPQLLTLLCWVASPTCDDEVSAADFSWEAICGERREKGSHQQPPDKSQQQFLEWPFAVPLAEAAEPALSPQQQCESSSPSLAFNFRLPRAGGGALVGGGELGFLTCPVGFCFVGVCFNWLQRGKERER